MLRRTLWQSMLGLLLLPAMLAAQSTWEEKNRAGEKAFQEGRLSDASRLFGEALRDAQKFGANDVRLAPIYNNLGLVSFLRNNFITSEVLFERAITVMELQGLENPLLLPVLDNLTSLYVKEWAFGRAVQTSWRAYHIRERRFGPESLETAAGLNKLATLYLDSVRLLPLSESEKAARPGLSTANVPPSNFSADLKDLSAAYGNAASLDDATKLAIAETLFGQVLIAQEKVYGNENARLVDVLENLGEADYAQGKGGAAEEAYARAIAIVEKRFGQDDPSLAMPLEQMAVLKTEDGNYADAEKFYRRAMQIIEGKAGAADHSLSAVLTGYAALLEKMGRSDEAKTLADRAESLAASRTHKPAIESPATSVPYILRFEKSVYDRYAGVSQTCMLIRADGRFRVEEQQQAPTRGPITAQLKRPPDGMPMNGLQETLADSSENGSSAPKIFESSLDGDAFQQLRAILSAKEIREIHGSYPRRAEGNYNPSTEKIATTILRDDGVQNFTFTDTSARQPYEGSLKPLFKWLSNAEKRKGAAIKGARVNDCSPDVPKAVPMEFTSLKGKMVQPATVAVATASAANQTPHDESQDKAARVRASVNLVLVRVVARDSQGRAVGTLRKEDFALLDNGRPQVIGMFSLERPVVGTSTEPSVSNGTSGGASAERLAKISAVERNIAYLFDDMHLNLADLDQVRSAADRHLSLQPAVRAAIFTTSGETALDFTGDRNKLHQALFSIKPHEVASSAGNDCPHIDAYLADLIVNRHDEDALGAVAEDALVCAYGNDARFAAAAENMARATARQRTGSDDAQSRIILRAFQTVLRQLAATPAQRALVLVSPGFVISGHEQEFGQLIDYALHSDISISSLDARGLYEVDSVAQRTSESSQHRRESASANGQILATLANATGGTLFHNNNDFGAGFTRVAESPEYSYLLGFLPQDQELDGRFHNLTVVFNGGEKLTLQARKGYYARKQ